MRSPTRSPTTAGIPSTCTSTCRRAATSTTSIPCRARRSSATNWPPASGSRRTGPACSSWPASSCRANRPAEPQPPAHHLPPRRHVHPGRPMAAPRTVPADGARQATASPLAERLLQAEQRHTRLRFHRRLYRRADPQRLRRPRSDRRVDRRRGDRPAHPRQRDPERRHLRAARRDPAGRPRHDAACRQQARAGLRGDQPQGRRPAVPVPRHRADRHAAGQAARARFNAVVLPASTDPAVVRDASERGLWVVPMLRVLGDDGKPLRPDQLGGQLTRFNDADKLFYLVGNTLRSEQIPLIAMGTAALKELDPSAAAGHRRVGRRARLFASRRDPRRASLAAHDHPRNAALSPMAEAASQRRRPRRADVDVRADADARRHGPGALRSPRRRYGRRLHRADRTAGRARPAPDLHGAGRRAVAAW